MKQYNAAQTILIALGGTAALVGGYEAHYYADYQTPKKAKRSRPKALGGFPEALRSHFAEKSQRG